LSLIFFETVIRTLPSQVRQKVFFNIRIPFLTWLSPLNKTDYQDDNSNDQYDVNKPSQRVTRYQPQEPQDYQYNGDRPQHLILLSLGAYFLPAMHPGPGQRRAGTISFWYPTNIFSYFQ
jgi:hypothetical protein